MNSRESEAALRRSFTLLLTCALLLWGAYTIAAPVKLGDNEAQNDNPHNLSSRSTTPGGETDIKSSDTTEICIFCHAPHGTTPQTTLWDRAAPGNMGSFGVNVSSNLDDPSVIDTSFYGPSGGDPDGYPNGASKLCLSCHDGVTALGVWNGDVEFVVSPGFMPTSTNLAFSHPISFVYDAAVRADLLALTGLTYNAPTSVPLDGSSRVQCTICHEPHNDTKGTGYILPFWRGPGTDDVAEYTNICDECHTNGYPASGLHTLP